MGELDKPNVPPPHARDRKLPYQNDSYATIITAWFLYPKENHAMQVMRQPGTLADTVIRSTVPCKEAVLISEVNILLR